MFCPNFSYISRDVTSPTHLTRFDLIVLKNADEEYKLGNFKLYNFIHPPITLSFSGTNIHRALFATLYILLRAENELPRSYVEIKCQLDATEVFIADLIACSTCFGHHYAHHQELKSIIQWLLPVVFGALIFKSLVWCGAEGYVSGLQDAAASCKPDT